MRDSFLRPLASALFLGLAPSLGAAAPQDEVDFLTEVRPILESRCFECHGAEKRKGRLQLHERALVMERTVKAGVVFLAGDPDGSPAIQRITLPAGDDDIMPPEGDPLTAEQIELLTRWVAEGANWPEVEGEGHAASSADPLALAPLSAEQAAAEEAALAALDAAGAHAMRVAQGMVAVEVNLGLLRDRCDDAMAANLAGLAPSLVWANLGGTAITDAALETLAGCGELRKLNLSNTAVTDAGLAQLAGLEKLEVLNLYGTGIGDAGLAHLSGLTNLRELYLWQTAVTADAVAALRASNAGLYVNTGIELAEAIPEPEEEPAGLVPVNTTCPLSGQPIDNSKIAVVDGQAIGLCCGDCLAKFEAEPEKYLASVEGFVPSDDSGDGDAPEPAPTPEPEDAAGAVNEECPFGCDFINPDVRTAVDGQWVGFCTPTCRVLFEQDIERHKRLVTELQPVTSGDAQQPEGALAEQPAAESAPESEGVVVEDAPQEEPVELTLTAAISPSCPFSGDPIRADSLTSYQGNVVGFCNPGCRDKFAADPEPHLHLIAEFLPEVGTDD